MTHENEVAPARNTESLTLKWGTLKRWDLKTPASIAAMKKYEHAGERSLSVIMQRDNPAQKEAICELIDCLDNDQIYLDWDEKYVTKNQAKDYVLNYGKKEHPPLHPPMSTQAPVHPYGHCPKCGSPEVARERRLNGNDVCERGHEYPSKDARPCLCTQEKAGANVQWTSKAEDAKRIYAALKAFEGIPTQDIDAGAVQKLVEALEEAVGQCSGFGNDATVARWKAALTPFQQKR